MNSRFSNAPEVIGTVSEIIGDDEKTYGDKVIGVSVRVVNGVAVAKLDVRELKRSHWIEIEIELSELVAAVSLATLNAEKE
jgi:hypothetical protein